MLRPEHVQTDGQVLLGTPLGEDSAGIAVSSPSYRERKLLEMVDAHDQRLRAVVGLARRSCGLVPLVFGEVRVDVAGHTLRVGGTRTRPSGCSLG